jgi:hypothetical protein
VFGVWSPGEDVAKLTYYGLYSLQHRGQESAGIAVSDGSRIVVYKDMGLVAQVFNESVLNTLRGYVAIGHCRYSTSGSSVWENAQPTFRSTPSASLALGHNGNLINTLELARLLGGPAGAVAGRATSDTEVLTALFAASNLDPHSGQGGGGVRGVVPAGEHGGHAPPGRGRPGPRRPGRRGSASNRSGCRDQPRRGRVRGCEVMPRDRLDIVRQGAHGRESRESDDARSAAARRAAGPSQTRPGRCRARRRGWRGRS